MIIKQYSNKLAERFFEEKRHLSSLLPSSVVIKHVGSSAVGIGGKNIIDILIGVPTRKDLKKVSKILVQNGYFMGNDNHSDRVFLASKQEETSEGDFHLHLCPVDEDSYKDFIILRDYLINNPSKAAEYLKNKHKFAAEAGFDRKKYKVLKASYVSKLLLEAKISLK